MQSRLEFLKKTLIHHTREKSSDVESGEAFMRLGFRAILTIIKVVKAREAVSRLLLSAAATVKG